MSRLDFQQPLPCGEALLYAPYENLGPHLLTPVALEPAADAAGRPDLRLLRYRGQNPALPPPPYGSLQLGLRARYPLETAALRLRERRPGARLEPVPFTGGWLRLQAPAGVELPPEAAEPLPLAWNGLASARIRQRLTAEGAQLLLRLLQDETLPLTAQAELELAGVAPRLPLRVRLDGEACRAALTARLDPQGRIARDELVGLFGSGQWGRLGLEATGEIEDPAELAETLADWVRARFGAFAPAPAADGRGYMTLRLDGLAGPQAWDLAQPLETRRPLVLALRPFEAARAAIRAAGPETVAPPPIVVPPLATGMHQVEVYANLPDVRPGAAAVGVTLRAPPHPPARPQAVLAAAELRPPGDSASLRLRLAPDEPLVCTYATFVILESDFGAEQLDGAEVTVTLTGHGDLAPRVDLAPGDFPVRFVLQAAQPELLELAILTGRCRWTTEDGTESALTFQLDADRPEAAVALPLHAYAASVEYELRPIGAGRSLRLGPRPLEPALLGLHMLPEFGPHEIVIERDESVAEPLLALDLLPEGRPEADDAIVVLALTPDRPKKSFTYFAASPFQAGYRYRRHTAEGKGSASGTAGPWSEVQSPFEPLLVRGGIP